MKAPENITEMAGSFLREKVENIEIHPNSHTGHNAIKNAQNILDLDGDGDIDIDDLSEGFEAASEAASDAVEGILSMIGDIIQGIFG